MNNCDILKTLIRMDNGLTNAFLQVGKEIRSLKKFKKRQIGFNLFIVGYLIAMTNDVVKMKEEMENQNKGES